MKDIKHILLNNIARPLRADKFVITHLRSFAGRARLAMSSVHDSPSSAKNNESMTKNDVISSSISETVYNNVYIIHIMYIYYLHTYIYYILKLNA